MCYPVFAISCLGPELKIRGNKLPWSIFMLNLRYKMIFLCEALEIQLVARKRSIDFEDVLRKFV